MKEIKYEKLTLGINENDTLTVLSCEKDATSVVIPFEIQDMPVVGIAESAFEGCDKLESVTLPCFDYDEPIEEYTDDIEIMTDIFHEIGDAAFQYCTSLREIVIPETVRSIGRNAFYGCTSLERVVLPESHCSIGAYAFAHCTTLTEISPVCSANEGMLSHCLKLESVKLRYGIYFISEDCFDHCESLVEIVIPKSARVVEKLAFSQCYSLKRVTFEDPESWEGGNSYTRNRYDLDLSDPEKNARTLSTEDFDDGNMGWYKKR